MYSKISVLNISIQPEKFIKFANDSVTFSRRKLASVHFCTEHHSYPAGLTFNPVPSSELKCHGRITRVAMYKRT